MRKKMELCIPLRLPATAEYWYCRNSEAVNVTGAMIWFILSCFPITSKCELWQYTVIRRWGQNCGLLNTSGLLHLSDDNELLWRAWRHQCPWKVAMIVLTGSLLTSARILFIIWVRDTENAKWSWADGNVILLLHTFGWAEKLFGSF